MFINNRVQIFRRLLEGDRDASAMDEAPDVLDDAIIIPNDVVMGEKG